MICLNQLLILNIAIMSRGRKLFLQVKFSIQREAKRRNIDKNSPVILHTVGKKMRLEMSSIHQSKYIFLDSYESELEMLSKKYHSIIHILIVLEIIAPLSGKF